VSDDRPRGGISAARRAARTSFCRSTRAGDFIYAPGVADLTSRATGRISTRYRPLAQLLIARRPRLMPLGVRQNKNMCGSFGRGVSRRVRDLEIAFGRKNERKTEHTACVRANADFGRFACSEAYVRNLNYITIIIYVYMFCSKIKKNRRLRCSWFRNKVRLKIVRCIVLKFVRCKRVYQTRLP